MLESSLNLLAAAGMVFSAISFRNGSRKLEDLQQKQQDIRQSQHFLIESGRDKHKSMPEKLKNQNKAMKVVLEVSSKQIKRLTSQTFSRTYNDFRVGSSESKKFKPYRYGFMENEVGGQFFLDWSGEEIKVDIRQCNIHQNLLFKNKPKKLQMIKGKENKYESISFNLKTGSDMVIAGILSYSLSEKQWILLPSFMINKITNITRKQQILGQAFKYLQAKAAQQKFKKVFSLVFILFFLAIRSNYIFDAAKKLFSKIKIKFQKQPQPSFDSIQEVIARESDKLRCQCGKTLNVIYQCSHLSSCQTCYEAGQVKRCPICGADGTQVLKIFT